MHFFLALPKALRIHLARSIVEFPSRIRCLTFLALLQLMLAGALLRAQIQPTQQLIPLTAGWNLVSIQVGTGMSPQVFQNPLSNLIIGYEVG